MRRSEAVQEQRLDGACKHRREPEGQLKGRIVAIRFDRNNGLARHANQRAQLGLGPAARASVIANGIDHRLVLFRKGEMRPNTAQNKG